MVHSQETTAGTLTYGQPTPSQAYGRPTPSQAFDRSTPYPVYGSYVRKKPASRSRLCRESSATQAHSSHCQQEAKLDRPVAGHVNLCPGKVDGSPAGLLHLTDNIKHEMMHTLGFSVQLFAFYRDPRGRPRTPRDSYNRPPVHPRLRLHLWADTTVRKVARTGWQVAGRSIDRNVTMLVTPRVRREAGRHFGCGRLEGGELEDQGDLGTALTHWEKRVFGDEAMTGNHQVRLGRGLDLTVQQ